MLIVIAATLIVAQTSLVIWLLRGRVVRARETLALKERLRFEALLSQLTAGLIHVPNSEIDAALEHALQQVVAFLGVDRGNLDEYLQGMPGVRISWASPGVEALPRLLDDSELPWTTQMLRAGQTVRFNRGDDLPETAAFDRASYERTGTRSHVSVPLRAAGAPLGVLSLDSVRGERTWPDELVERLSLLGEAFASALERKRAELEAQRLRQNLTRIGRVSAMGELTASLAHELNQPLAAILSNAQAALRFLASDAANLDEIREILDDIVADDKRAGHVIHRLRGLLKKADFEYVPLDLNDVVSEVARLVRNDAVIRNVSMGLELAPGLPRVRGDRVQLQQVVLNLVLNAFDAMRAPASGDQILIMRTERDGAAAVRVSVHDSGLGIDENSVESMFQPLYTTKAEGLGMGLAIARTIVDAHGGRLGAANNPSGGATFGFTLPVGTETEG